MQATARPVLFVPIIFNSSNPFEPVKDENLTLLEAMASDKSNINNETKLIDPSKFITLRENDWRDNHERKMIIWSVESIHHPDYGKNYPKGGAYRLTTKSQVMSFVILGSVIGFILYTYLSHVIMMRRLNRELKAANLRELVHRSAMIMAGSAQENDLNMPERRHSLINMFGNFRL
ncbi:unnamed protein product [Cylicocyclus nassatus]|uniref:Uncharacterized protein n=1 Tax=Cylicocyclus nassatus TaxID=53992 RepID=A0AA36GW86_CYLNA|nr:unnamed protein product [Cylicocyclus nassatus]